jgi:hypothetical protein
VIQADVNWLTSEPKNSDDTDFGSCGENNLLQQGMSDGSILVAAIEFI